MKKLTPYIISVGLTLPVATIAMGEGPIDGKIYGKINTAVLGVDNKVTKESDTFVTNQASRLGFKGKTELDGGIKVIYQLEYQIAPDEPYLIIDKDNTDSAGDTHNDKGIFRQRNAYVGLETVGGTVLAGTHDTPFKLAQGKVDQFNDLIGGDIAFLVEGENRENDLLLYSSPEFSGIKVMVAGTVSEDTSGDDGQSASVSYSNENLYVALAMDTDVDGLDGTRVAATYKIDAFTVGALIDQTEPNTGTGTEDDAYIISGAYKVGQTTLKLQFGSSEETSGSTSVTDEQIAVGADYKLGDKTKLYAYYSMLENDVSPKTLDKTFLGGGLEHKF
jgi:predicted porin